jgi:hypothetical protein
MTTKPLSERRPIDVLHDAHDNFRDRIISYEAIKYPQFRKKYPQAEEWEINVKVRNSVNRHFKEEAALLFALHMKITDPRQLMEKSNQWKLCWWCGWSPAGRSCTPFESEHHRKGTCSDPRKSHTTIAVIWLNFLCRGFR